MRNQDTNRRLLSLALCFAIMFSLIPSVKAVSSTALAVSGITGTEATLTITNPGDASSYPVVYYLVQGKGEAAPDAGTLKSTGTQTQDSNFTTGSSTTTSVSISDLNAGTDYVAYAVIFYAKTQSYSDVFSAEFSTSAEEIEGIAVSIAEVTDSGASLTVENTSAETGTYPVAYYMVKQANEAAPDAQTLRTSGTQTMDSGFTTGSSKSTIATLSGLIAGTNYVAYVVIYHAKNQTFSDVASVEFSTNKGEAPEPVEGDVMSLSYTSANGNVTKNYVDYSEAIQAMNTLGDEYTDVKLTLLNDLSINVQEYRGKAIEISRTCALDLAGKTVSVTSDQEQMYGIYAEGNLTFTLMDSSKDNSGQLVVASPGGTGIAIGSPLVRPAPTEYEDMNFAMEGGTVRSYSSSTGSDNYAISGNQYANLSVSGGIIKGGMSVNGNLTLTGGKVEAKSPIGVITLGAFAKFVMSGGEVVNTDTVTAIATRICAVSVSQLSNNIDGAQVDITGGMLSSIKGPALYLSNNASVDTSVLISGTAMLLSESAAALYFDSQTTTNGALCKISIKENAKLSGNTNAIEIENTDRAESFLSINIDGGYFRYSATSIPFAPNSSFISYPDGEVLDVNPVSDGVFNGYYALTQAENMTQMIGTQEWGYQYLDELQTALDGAEAIYQDGNGRGTYDSELWTVFSNAYEAALPILYNTNANQNEIDYFSGKLGEAQSKMIAMAENGIDVSHLADGTYTVEIEMRTASFNGLSMSNGAIQPQATLEVKNQIGTMTIDFKPIMQLGYYGSLFQFWVFDGNTPADGKATYTAHSGDPSYMHEAVYPSFQIVNFNNGAVKPIEGLPAEQPTLENEVRPAAARITLPYMGSSNDYNKIYCYLGVDMMRQIGVGDQPAILYIKYSTLKAESVNETLLVDTAPMNLLIGGKQMTEAKVLGGSGWTITAESGAPEVASASMEQGKITVMGVGQGSATITVTASKDGQNPLRKEFTVTVAPTGATAVKASGGTVTGGTAQYTVDGNFIVTNESTVDVSGDEITITADHAASGAEITITADAARTLSAASKNVVIQTAQGNIALNIALMRTVSAQTDDVVLAIHKMDEDEITLDSTEQKSKITSLYELNLKKGGANGESIRFNGGQATVTVPWSAKYGYAYAVEDGKLEEVLTMTVIEDSASWTTGHFSVWALSRYENLMDEVGIKTGTYSVPITIKQASQPSLDSMANDATGDMVVADVTDSGVTYTMFLKARVGTELGSEPLRGHLLKMWYYAVDDTDREYPIPATVVRTYKDTDMNGKIDTFPREVDVRQEGEPQSQYYIQVYVDAMGTNYQDALVKLDWDRALDDGGKAAREGFEDDLATEQTIKSGDKVSRSDLKKWIDNEFTLLVEGKDDDLSMHFDTEALEDIYNQTDSDVKFVIEQASKSKLTEEQKEVIGDRPVYELAITSGKKTITKIEDGEVEITLPYALQKDEKKDGIAIWFVDEDGGIEKIRFSYSEKNKKITFFTERFGICVIAYDEEQIWVNPFTDVSEEDWFFESVKYVVQNGLFNGTTETTFSPTRTMTRGMLVTVLYRLAGKPEVTNPNSFSDVLEDSYCAEAVAWATQNKIVSGYEDGLFRPDNNVTRQQMVAILYNYAKHKDYDVSLVKGLDDFTDSHLIGSYAIRAMQWATANEIVYGTTSTTLYPHGESTRAQVAVVLMRFNEKIVIPQEKAKEEAARETEETAKKS